MRWVLAPCVVLGAVLGTVAAREPAGAPVAERKRSAELRDAVEQLRVRLGHLQREIAAAATPAAATAAREKLFQLRVDMVALEDELATLAGRRPVAGNARDF